MDHSDISEFAANDTKTYTRWLLACRALHSNPPEAVNTTHFLNLPDSLLPLAWRVHWDRQMPLRSTRELNTFIREIAGLDLSLRISFAQYPLADQRRAIGRVRNVFLSMNDGDAMLHLYKAVTVYAAEQRRQRKVATG